MCIAFAIAFYQKVKKFVFLGGVAPTSQKNASGGQGVAPNPTGKCQGRCPRHPRSMPPAGRAPPCTCDLLKKVDQNFSTEKFYGANSVRSIQNIAYLPDRLGFCSAHYLCFLGALPPAPKVCLRRKHSGRRPRHPRRVSRGVAPNPKGCLRRAGRRPAPASFCKSSTKTFLRKSFMARTACGQYRI